MTNIYRKWLGCCFVIVISILLQVCGKHETSHYVEDSEATISSEDVTYESSDIILQGIEGKIQQCSMRDDMLYVLSEQQENSHLYKADVDGNNTVEVTVLSEDVKVNSFYIDNERNIFCLVTTEQSEYPTELIKIDAEGKEVVRKKLQELLSLSQEEMLSQVVVDDVGNVILADEHQVYSIDPAMQHMNAISVPKNTSLISFIKTKSGCCACVVEENDQDGDESETVCILDLKKREWKNNLKMPHHAVIDECCLMEGQEYDFYYKDGAGIFGYNNEDTSWTKILDARCSLLTVQDIKGMIQEVKGYFLRVPDDSEKGGERSTLELYSKLNPKEQEDKKIITIAGYNVTNQLREVARNFNKTHKDCKVVIQIYEDEDQEKLILDIMTGKAPDIFSISALQLSMERLAKKGVLEDLTPYYEKDTEVHLEDVVPSVLESLKIDGRLYCVTPYYFIISAASRTSDVEGREGWNFKEMIEALNKKGENTIAFDTLDKSELLADVLPESSKDFVNWESGECNYDSQDYKDILEFCNNGSDTDQDLDYEEMQEVVAKKIREGNVLSLADMGVNVYGVQVARQRLGDDITYIGLPVKDRNGSFFQFGEQYGIFSGSEVKEEAWELIRMVMSEEYQAGAVLDYEEFYPTRTDCLEWKFQTQMATKSYEDKFGNIVEPMEKSTWITEFGEKIEVGPASQEDVNIVMNLIEQTKKRLECDNTAAEIEYEEALKYFAGKQSLNKTVDVIQNRMTTYVNEQR